MTDGFILLRDGEVTLVVLGSIATAIEQKFRERDVAITVAATFYFIHKPAKTYECLLHFLMTVKPFLFGRGPDMVGPAVAQFFRGVVQPIILAIGHRIMIDRRLNEVSRDVPLVIGARGRAPPLRPRLR